jgi:hypothetical protein
VTKRNELLMQHFFPTKFVTGQICFTAIMSTNWCTEVFLTLADLAKLRSQVTLFQLG